MPYLEECPAWRLACVPCSVAGKQEPKLRGDLTGPEASREPAGSPLTRQPCWGGRISLRGPERKTQKNVKWVADPIPSYAAILSCRGMVFIGTTTSFATRNSPAIAAC